MATLTSRLVISLHDKVSGPAGVIRRQLDLLRQAAQRPIVGGAFNLGRQMEAEARRVQAAAQRVAGSLTPAAFGMGALIHATQDYERAFYGVKAAMIADNMDEKIEAGIKRNVVNLEGIRSSADLAKQEVEKLSKAMMMRPTALMKAWESVGKAGVPYSLDGLSPEEKKRRLLNSQRTLVEMGGEVHRQDTEMPVDRAAEFLHTLGINFKAGTDKFERGKGSRDYDTDIAKIANQLLYVANATKTSASKLSAGLRQYAPLYGNLGNSFSESAAMLGAMVQGGLDEVEGGTALKSMGVRFIKNFTSEGRDAWLAAGLRREDYTNETAVSGKRAAQTLGQLTDKPLSKKQKDELRGMFLKAEKSGRMKDPQFIADVARVYNQMTGARDQATRDRNLERIRMATFSAGNDIDMFKLFRDLSLKMGKMSEADREKSIDAWGMGELGDEAVATYKKRMAAGTLTQSQLAVTGEGRHLSRYNALLALFGTAEELERRARSLNNREVTTAGRDLAKDDAFWKWEHAMGRLEAAMAKLRESDAVTGFINGVARVAEALASASPWAQELAGHLLVLAAIGAPIALAVGLVAGALTMLRGSLALLLGVLRGAGRLLGLGGAAATTVGGAGMAGLFGAGAAGVASSAAGRKLTAGLSAAGALAANNKVGGKMISGMSAAAAGGAAGGGAAKGGGLLARLAAKGTARMLIPGAVLGMAGYDAYQGYQQNGWTGALLNALTLGMYSGKAQAATGPTVTAAGQAVAANAPSPQAQAVKSDVAGVQSSAQAMPAAVRSAMDQVRAIVASVDLTADGQRVAESFAAGIRNGAGAVAAAASESLGAQVRGAVRGGFSDGGVR